MKRHALLSFCLLLGCVGGDPEPAGTPVKGPAPDDPPVAESPPKPVPGGTTTGGETSTTKAL